MLFRHTCVIETLLTILQTYVGVSDQQMNVFYKNFPCQHFIFSVEFNLQGAKAIDCICVRNYSLLNELKATTKKKGQLMRVKHEMK